MGEANESVLPISNSPQWDRATIFKTLADPGRCALLYALGRGGPSTASQLKVGVNRKLDATTKQLAYLREIGLLAVAPDPKDARRTLYFIAPAVPMSKTPTGATIDFGFCLLRM